MEQSKWVPVCKKCGLRLNMKVVFAKGLNPPALPPAQCPAYGAPLDTYGCDESADRRHKFVWERWL